MFIDSKTVYKHESFNNSFMSTLWERFGSAGENRFQAKETKAG
jgi:hypothetical protein